jgi:hypothetical protein
MSHEDLEQLLAPDFGAQVVASTPRILRLRLRRSPTVRELRKRYDEGALPDESLRRFVNGLLRQHTDPDSFPYQTALAAIAVVLEDRYAPLSEEYLIDLARVKTGRLSTASRVARLCLNARSQRPTNERHVFPPETEIELNFEGRVTEGSGRFSWNVPAPGESTFETQVY